MAQLSALLVSADEEFHRHLARWLRSSGVPVGVIDERRVSAAASGPDLVVVDLRHDVAAGLATLERLRTSFPTATVCVVAAGTEPELILQAMRAGANEFFAWPTGGDALPGARLDEAFQGAVRRAAARRDAAQGGARAASTTLAFIGAKGGAGTTTVAVNCAVELARLTKRATLIVDLKPSLGEVALFLGVRPRFTVLDALDNLHRLDREFLKELVAKHKSGLDILAGSDKFDRPSGQDAEPLEELLRVLARSYEYVVVDVGNWINSCAVAALYAADTIFLVANPDVPSVRNAQRLIERVRQLGAGSERVKVLLNRVTDQHLIAPKQIEAALGYAIYHSFASDYQTVAMALNSGVPLALANHSELAAQFDRFTRRIVGPEAGPGEEVARRKGHFLGLI